MSQSNHIADTIFAQLGGARFVAMTGARALVAHPDALTFKLPRTAEFVKGGINYVVIRLNALDTYDLDFARLRGVEVTVIERATNVYADQLRAVFTRATGLDTHLGGAR